MSDRLRRYYFHVCSQDSLDIFPDNNASNFKIQLPSTLYLEGNWECGLMNISFWPEFTTETKPKEIYIGCDLIVNSYAMNNLFPVLKRISVPSNLNTKINIHFPEIDFIDMHKKIIQTVHFYIYDDKSEFPSFAVKDLYCSLHLRQKE